MRTQQQAGQPSVDSWEGADQDPFWAEMDEKRRERRGW
jgi:hypothetical protein